MIIFLPWIERSFVKKNLDKTFVFGDNTERVGMGGQARAMRGEPNALGVVTKRKPTMDSDAFFSDENDDDWEEISVDLDKLCMLHMNGKTIVIPSDGLGTGLSMLDTKAPKIYSYLYDTITKLYGQEIPWPKPKQETKEDGQ